MRVETKEHVRRRVGQHLLVLAPGNPPASFYDPTGEMERSLELCEERSARGAMDTSLSLEETSVRECVSQLDAAGLLCDPERRAKPNLGAIAEAHSNSAFYNDVSRLRTPASQTQQKLAEANVAVVGVGGIGSAVLPALVGAGVGHMTLIDFDVVDQTNLCRQFVYSASDVGHAKVDAATAFARAINPRVGVTAKRQRIDSADDAYEMVGGASLVVVAADQPTELRLWINEAAVRLGIPIVCGAVRGREGCYYSIAPMGRPCLECLVERVARAGGTTQDPFQGRSSTLGAICSTLGGLMALECIRYLTAIAVPASAGTVTVLDALDGTLGRHPWEPLDGCAVCDPGGGRDA